jgi:predicted kinase
VADAIDRIEPGAGGTLRTEDLRDRCRREFLLRFDEFAARKALGFVRECHGDMHLGNMFLSGRKVTIFDGIEFNDEFRWIDVMSEAAFAVMDLEDRGRHSYARRLLNAYLEHTGDSAGLKVLRFYLTYRAAVRAAISSIRPGQEVAAGTRQLLGAQMEGYLELADRFTRPPRPMLVITHGVSGSGKTTVTQSILETVGAVRVRSDVERKRLCGKAPLDHRAADIGAGIYSEDVTARTYARVAELAEAVVCAGFPAVIDATCLRREERDRFRRLAERLRVPFAILDVRAADSVARDRTSRRSAQGGDASDAGLAALEHQLRVREPLGTDEVAQTVVIDTEAETSAGRAGAALRALSDRQALSGFCG